MTYNLYIGAKFEVSNGQPMNVYEVLVLSKTHVTYTELISNVSRTVTIPTFLKFLEDSGARQV